MGDAQTRAETYLRLLAEAALRPATRSDDRADRVTRAADILLDAGVLTEERATDLLLMLGSALRVRGRPGLPLGGSRARRLGGAAVRQWLSLPAPPAWRVITKVARQLPGARLMALVVTADRMIAPATLLRFPPSAGLDDLTPPAFTDLTARDDVGTDYQLSFTDGSWAGSTWTGTIVARPAAAPGARLLTIASPNGPLLVCDLTPAPATAPVAAAVGRAGESRGERLLHRRAEAMLAGLASGQPGQGSQPLSDSARRRAVGEVMDALSAGLSPVAAPVAGRPLARSSLGRPWSEASLPELAATLEGAGVLSPLSVVPGQVATLAEALGGPPAGGHGPGTRLPSRWTGVLAHYGRRHHPPLAAGTGSIGTEFPPVEGTNFVIAGVRTSAAGTVLHVVGRAWRRLPLPGQPMGLSWWARDSSSGWHLGMVSTWNLANENLTMRLSLFPPLRPGEPGTADTLTLEVTGNTEYVTADLTVRWSAP